MKILPDFLKIQNEKKYLYHVLLLIVMFFCDYLSATVTERKGWWKFDNTNSLTSPVNGYDKASLTLVGSHVAVGGDEEGDDAVLIGVGSHYELII